MKSSHLRKLLLLVTLILLTFSSLGCRPKVEYPAQSAFMIKKGDPSPIDGWVVDNGTFVMLYEFYRAHNLPVKPAK